MLLSDRVLDVWLGERYIPAAPAAAVFLSLWLFAPNLFVANSLMIVERELRKLTIYAWGTALVNLVLSLVLTALFGLVGVAIGTTVGYLALMPYFASFAFAGRGVTIREFAKEVWVPAYGGALVLALALVAVRLAIPLDQVWSVVAVIVAAVGAYWAGLYMLAADVTDRQLVRDILGRS
jgi:O-antigen/teichoic acid export membrane protein